jgi:hypothetical protein
VCQGQHVRDQCKEKEKKGQILIFKGHMTVSLARNRVSNVGRQAPVGSEESDRYVSCVTLRVAARVKNGGCLISIPRRDTPWLCHIVLSQLTRRQDWKRALLIERQLNESESEK